MGCPSCSGDGRFCQCLLEDPDGARLAGQGSAANPLVVPTAVVVGGLRGTVTITEAGVASQRTTYTIAAGATLSANAEAPVTGEQVTGFSRFVGQPVAVGPAGTIGGTFQLPGRIWVVIYFAVPLPAVPRAVILTKSQSLSTPGQPMYVNEITAARFRVELVGASSGSSGGFSYMVVR